jgi:glycosyl transferase, family 25
LRLGFFFDRSIIRYKSSTTGAQAYLMSRKAAHTFVHRFRSISTSICLTMDRFWESGMPIYSIFPYPVRYSPTSIPIPISAERPPIVARCVWTLNRVVDKARKIGANWMLRPADAKMKRVTPEFSQIF